MHKKYYSYEEFRQAKEDEAREFAYNSEYILEYDNNGTIVGTISKPPITIKRPKNRKERKKLIDESFKRPQNKEFEKSDEVCQIISKKVPEIKTEDPEIIKKPLKGSPERLKSDKLFYYTAFLKDITSVKFFPWEVFKDISFLRRLVNRDTRVLEFFPKQLLDSYSFMMDMIKNVDPDAINFLGKQLSHNKQFILEAMDVDIGAAEYRRGRALRLDNDILLKYMTSKKHEVFSLPRERMESEDFLLLMLENKVDLIDCTVKRFKRNQEFLQKVKDIKSKIDTSDDKYFQYTLKDIKFTI